jgi:serine/threonine-protein kinase
MRSEQEDRIYRFGPFSLDSRERVLLRDGRLVPLPAKSLSTLLTLILSKGHLVEKEVLMKEVWPDEFVEEGNLTQHIFMLRRALGETANGPKYIETVPRRGYRFVGEINKPTLKERGTSINSLAILPFSNGSSDPDMQYLSDGITESVINSLSHLPQLRVMARSTVFRYQGIDVQPQEIGESLGVRAVMMGRVQQFTNQLVISAELVDAHDGARIWGDQYRRNLSDIFSLQEELASEISEKLRLSLSHEQKERVTKRFTESTEAYQFYLRGRYCWSKRTDEELRKGVEYFRKAIAEDPNYALAYAGLADSLLLIGMFGADDPRAVMPQAKTAALKAIQLDETLGEAYASLAQIKFTYEWDWPGAEQDFKEALKLSPTYSTAYHWYGEYLEAMGQVEAGLAELKKARDIDPLSLVINTSLGMSLYFAGRDDEAIEHLKRATELEPRFVKSHLVLGLVYLRKSMRDEAMAEIETARQLTNYSWADATLGFAHAVLGEHAEAEKQLRRLTKQSRTKFVSALTFAMLHAGFADHADQTMEWLQKSFEERAGLLVWLGVWPIFDNMRSDPRFVDLLKRIGLPTVG